MLSVIFCNEHKHAMGHRESVLNEHECDFPVTERAKAYGCRQEEHVYLLEVCSCSTSYGWRRLLVASDMERVKEKQAGHFPPLSKILT